MFAVKNIKQLFIRETMMSFPAEWFVEFENHLYDSEPLSNHLVLLAKIIIEKYFEIRIHHDMSLLDDSRQARIRSKLTKTVLFKNQ